MIYINLVLFFIGITLFSINKWKLKMMYVALFISFFIMSLIWAITNYYVPYNASCRNKIEFLSPIKDVQDSIIKMNSFLYKLPVYKDDWAMYSVNDSNILTINFKVIGRISKLKSLNDSLQTNFSKNFTSDDIESFTRLIFFFKENYLSRCDFFRNSNTIRFIYRENKEDVGDYQDDLLRFLFYSPNNTFNKDIYKNIDSKEKLILLSYRKAKIWVRD